MRKRCHDVEEWVQEKITKPVDRWVSRTEQKCKDYPWYDPRGWVCWLVTIVVKVVDWVVDVINTLVTHVVCVIVGAVLDAAAFVVGLVVSIPLIGPLIKGVIRTIAEVISQVVGIIDMGGRLIGIRIPKNLRICIVILNDNRIGVVNPTDLDLAIAFAQETFYREAKIKLTVNSVRTVDRPSPRDNLDVDANAGAVWNELWVPGSYFETAANGYCFDDAFSRVVAIGGPVIVFVVRSVAGDATGCSLAFLTDYVTIEGGTFVGGSVDKTVLAHELGHSCSLLHVQDPQNLMFPTSTAGSRGSSLEAGQVSLMRGSRHVTFV